MDKRFDFSDFFDPPKQYGIVSFYWWVGEKLEKERLLWQLDRITDMGICGVQINYCHTDEGGLSYGLPFKSDPEQFSAEWWELFNWFVSECEKRSITVSLSDYTLATAGQGYFMDDILSQYPHICGGYAVCKACSVAENEPFTVEKAPDRIVMTAYPVRDGRVCTDGAISIDQEGQWTAPMDCVVAEISYERVPCSLDPMNEMAGKAVTEAFFDRFEQNNPGKCGKALNFFFSDELSFGVSGKLWNEKFAAEFRKRKGYDLLPLLYALWDDIGAVTQKVRLDYYDVIVALEEENYFKPVFDWHEKRGMTYGCDHGGRGHDVTEFGDYFRTQKYNQGPGNDQPQLQYDIIKNKVASSISHLYDRPRTWLEGFYSSGWSTGSAELFQAVCRNFVMGHNLLSLHGLYYTTVGSYWEWAPPCNHFRMPYWAHMKKLNTCVTRMSYLNTRGIHRCDVGIIYPVAAMEGGMDGEASVRVAFELGEYLYRHGIDFDFLDFESVQNAAADNGVLTVGERSYRAVVVPNMKTVRFGCIEKLARLKECGGEVYILGNTPIASERAGRNDAVLDECVQRILNGEAPAQSNEQIVNMLERAFTRDFKMLDGGEVFYLHRSVTGGELYAVYGAAEGSGCFVRAKGRVYLLDALEGRVYRLPKTEETSQGMIVTLPQGETRMQYLYVTENELDVPNWDYLEAERSISIDTMWRTELVPTMDNTYGDFFKPDTASCIGAQIRRPVVNGERTTLGYGAYFALRGPFAADELSAVQRDELLRTPQTSALPWREYRFSMRYGVENDPGHQGWHGLKGKITDEFIALGMPTANPRGYTYVEEKPCAEYYMYTYVYAEEDMWAEILTGEWKYDVLYADGIKCDKSRLYLTRGHHLISMRFIGAGRTFVVLRRQGTPIPEGQQLAMRWYTDTGMLPFDLYAGQVREEKFEFEVPSGTRSFTYVTEYESEVSVEGSKAVPHRNGRAVTVNMDKNKAPAHIRLTVSSKGAQRGAASIDGFIETECGEGLLGTGDWGETAGLEYYSGGMVYTAEVSAPDTVDGERVLLSLGQVGCSAEVSINGTGAGILIAPPYTVDVTDLLVNGDNRIEIKVYSTLYNHYKTVPTRYNEPTVSGLIGPVEWRIMKRRAY